MKIRKIISGGQTGADQAGLRAARRAGIETGGWAPRGWLVEHPSGRGHVPNPNLRDFGLLECPKPAGEPFAPLWQWYAACYQARTIRNAREADITVWFFDPRTGNSRGFELTQSSAVRAGRPFVIASNAPGGPGPEWFADQWGSSLFGTVNIAGSRESKAPGIGARVEDFLCRVFECLGARPIG